MLRAGNSTLLPASNNPLLVPTFTSTLEAFWEALTPAKGVWEKAWSSGDPTAIVIAFFSGELFAKGLNSVRLLLQGYATGLFLATILTTLAILTTIGNDFLETLTSMFNPLPAIALLPLALIWFGLGDKSIIFVLVHSVLWAVALNTHSGFKSVSNTLRMVGRNYGLERPQLCDQNPDSRRPFRRSSPGSRSAGPLPGGH